MFEKMKSNNTKSNQKTRYTHSFNPIYHSRKLQLWPQKNSTKNFIL